MGMFQKIMLRMMMAAVPYRSNGGALKARE
jgi:hypothetical protein